MDASTQQMEVDNRGLFVIALHFEEGERHCNKYLFTDGARSRSSLKKISNGQTLAAGAWLAGRPLPGYSFDPKNSSGPTNYSLRNTQQ